MLVGASPGVGVVVPEVLSCMVLWLDFELWRTGRETLLRLCDEDDLDRGNLNRDRFGCGGKALASGGSFREYRPVSGSASGAVSVISFSGSTVEAMKSFPDNLSLSITVNDNE